MNKKILAAVLIISIFSLVIFTVPVLLDKKVDPLLSISIVVMISIYLVLSLELLHRTSIALLGATILIIATITLGTLSAQKSLDFITEIIDFNTIGLLLG